MKTSKAKKKTVRKRVQKLVETNTTLELFLKALTQLYPMDKLAPGIVISYLSDRNQFYVSVARYDIAGSASPTNPGAKQILCSAQASKLDAAIIALVLDWQGRAQDAERFMKHDVNVHVRRHGKLVR